MKNAATKNNQIDKNGELKQFSHVVVWGCTKKKLDKDDKELYRFMVGGLQAK